MHVDVCKWMRMYANVRMYACIHVQIYACAYVRQSVA